MKTESMIALALAGLAVYVVARAQKTGKPVTQAVQEVLDAAGKKFDNGWRYFTDGTTIDPDGNYYFGGQLVWMNPDVDQGKYL